MRFSLPPFSAQFSEEKFCTSEHPTRRDAPLGRNASRHRSLHPVGMHLSVETTTLLFLPREAFLRNADLDDVRLFFYRETIPTENRNEANLGEATPIRNKAELQQNQYAE
jgi:hypothetical protein